MSDVDTDTFAMGSMFEHPYPVYDQDNPPPADDINEPLFDLDVLANLTSEPQQELLDGPYDLSASHPAVQFDSDMTLENTTQVANLCPPGPCWVCFQVFCVCDLNVFNNAFNLTALDVSYPPPEPYLPVFESNQAAAQPPDPVSFSDLAFPPLDPPVSAVDLELDRCGQESHTPERRDPPSTEAPEPQSVPKAARKRARIKDATLAILDRQFGIDAYPKAGELSSLRKATNLTPKEIKTWFTNARSRRKKGTGWSQYGIIHHSTWLTKDCRL
jgi:hypothetical protein